MAKVSFLPEKVAPPIDGKLEEVGAQAVLASRPIRLRLQPDLYNLDRQSYDSWSGLTWTLELDDVEEGRRFREALGTFMAAFGDPEKQGALLGVLQTITDAKGLTFEPR